ncbi:MAG: glycine--tRNA ligase [Candidatus Marsarchaeota archaeon]|jgi:glycyl-tRNA synthetase|nr:glycine--tRNA ligase [Candidatus Marsarchaeota archaeon]
MNIEELQGFAKKSGFFWPSAEIYGGVSGMFDYGHLGTLMKKKFEAVWLNFFVERNQNYYLIEGSNILPEKVLIASGHAERFNDIIVGCSNCNTYHRADILLDELGIFVSEGATAEEMDKAIRDNNVKCPKCKGELGKSRAFNMMLEVMLGPEKKEKGYLRPETAQSVYLNFFREFNILRKKLPLGLAIIGKAYRNEISPRQGLYRMRELTQAELQIFFDPENFEIGENTEILNRMLNVVLYKEKKQKRISGSELIKEGFPKFYVYHMCLIDYFYKKILLVPDEKMRFLEKGGNEKAFYNKVHMDLEINVESWKGFKEVGGLHYRGDYDLTSHSKGSMQDLSVGTDKKFIPNVLELSFGVDRNIWMLLDLFSVNEEGRSLLKVRNFIAPFNIAIFPLQKDEALINLAKQVYSSLKSKFNVYFDESGSIGRRYARMDEIGTPFCITVDFDSIDAKSENYMTVTIRRRDTRSQERVQISKLPDILSGEFESD